jgi:hypothetical protein
MPGGLEKRFDIAQRQPPVVCRDRANGRYGETKKAIAGAVLAGRGLEEPLQRCSARRIRAPLQLAMNRFVYSWGPCAATQRAPSSECDVSLLCVDVSTLSLAESSIAVA